MALIYISVGSNIDREHYVRAGVRKLAEHFGALTLSSVYESEAVGFNGDPFYNLVVGVETTLSLTECVTLLKEIEDQYVSGLVTQGERYNKVVDIWGRTGDQVAKVMMDELGHALKAFDADPALGCTSAAVSMNCRSGSLGSEW
mgnify:CR=1 FL=1